MGLISRSYNRPGPGVDPDEPQKRSFFRFFEIFKRKIGHFAKANLTYVLTLIPTLIIIFMVMTYIMSNVTQLIVGESEGTAFAMLVCSILLTLFYVSVMGAGPATAGMTYVMRNFANEEHSWIWTDFMDNLKSNFKQASIVFVIDIFAVLVVFIASYIYTRVGGAIGMLRYALYALLLVYAAMHLYIYPLMVTFKLSLKDIYKNSLIFALAKMPTNLLILFVNFIVHIGLPIFIIFYLGKYVLIALIILTVLEAVIAQAFSAFMVNFNAYPKIKKYMLDVAEESKMNE